MAKLKLTPARKALAKAVADSDKWDLKSLSEAVGKNHAYIQQYINRGSPMILPEDVRTKLSKLLDIDERVLRDAGAAPAPRTPQGESFELVPIMDISASAGNGSFADGESILGYQPFREQQISRLTNANYDSLAVILVRGDSMEPTLSNQDQVLVDTSVTKISTDGIYIIALEDDLLVKRCKVDLNTRDVLVISDNEKYPMDRVTKRSKLDVKGRVIWIGRALG